MVAGYDPCVKDTDPVFLVYDAARDPPLECACSFLLVAYMVREAGHCAAMATRPCGRPAFLLRTAAGFAF